MRELGELARLTRPVAKLSGSKHAGLHSSHILLLHQRPVSLFSQNHQSATLWASTLSLIQLQTASFCNPAPVSTQGFPSDAGPYVGVVTWLTPGQRLDFTSPLSLEEGRTMTNK